MPWLRQTVLAEAADVRASLGFRMPRLLRAGEKSSLSSETEIDQAQCAVEGSPNEIRDVIQQIPSRGHVGDDFVQYRSLCKRKSATSIMSISTVPNRSPAPLRASSSKPSMSILIRSGEPKRAARACRVVTGTVNCGAPSVATESNVEPVSQSVSVSSPSWDPMADRTTEQAGSDLQNDWSAGSKAGRGSIKTMVAAGKTGLTSRVHVPSPPA